MMTENIQAFIADQHMRLAEAMQKIDDNSNGILFVIDENKCLCGAVSDGDIRRWLLKAGSIDAEIGLLMSSNPISIKKECDINALAFMREKCIRALPVVDDEGRIQNIYLAKLMEKKSDQVAEQLNNVSAVIMAGGKGTRLYPYTKILPKPLIPIGEVPIVERVMDSFYECGITDFIMTVNYRKHMIQSYFSETSKPYNIEYVEEDKPLGTGGSLKLIQRRFEKPLFVANCDSFVRTSYSDLYKYHLENSNAITMVTSLKNDTIPYGVVYSKENCELDHMVEKPTRSYLINTGIYIINPKMIDLIPDDTMFHMTHLVDKAKKLGYKVGMFPISEDSFLDMGEFAEMKRMEEKLNIQ